MCVDMEFLVRCSTWYLTSERSKWVRYQVESISTSSHVLFCLSYKHTIDDFLTIFQRFPNTFWRFPKVPKSCPQTRQSFLNIFRKFPKIAEHNRTFSKNNWWRFDLTGAHASKYFSRDSVTIAMVIFSLQKISKILFSHVISGISLGFV